MTSEHTFDPRRPFSENWSTFRELVAPFDQYRRETGGTLRPLDDQLHTLRRGLVEEIYETKIEQTLDTSLERQKFTGEIGDILYYLSHISDSVGETADNTSKPTPLPIYNIRGEVLLFDDPLDTLSVNVLRICDNFDPYMHTLWIDQKGYITPIEDRPKLSPLVSSAVHAVDSLSRREDIEITDAMQVTVDKLNSRKRNPHVIDHARGDTEPRPISKGRLYAIMGMTSTALNSLLDSELIEKAAARL